MQVSTVDVDRAKARELYKDYKKHVHYSEPIDDEIRRCYQLIAQGKLIIKALESIATAGLGDDGLPKLAIARANAPACGFELGHAGQGTFHDCGKSRWDHRSRNRIDFPVDTFPRKQQKAGQAIIPIIPIHLRPRRGLANYHILWEADWKEVPVDPLLLRRIGKGDLWLVVAQWDLTEVERSAMKARL